MSTHANPQSFSGLALWLVSTNAGRDSDRDHDRDATPTLKEIQRHLVRANRGSVEFGIHATLLSGLDAGLASASARNVDDFSTATATATATANGGGLEVEFQDVTTRGMYFQCILVSLVKTPALASLNHIVAKQFKNPTSAPSAPSASGSASSSAEQTYFPHISLLYADLDEQAATQQIQDLEHDGYFTRHSIGEEHGDKDGKLNHVQVVDCNGPPDAWKVLRSVAIPPLQA
ncbi:hypothetical protein BCV70DRAFT_163849 [Testicularia cyperi]|uniref:2, 3 cyclic phosphodiesterase n=1 Tax=Testicularia cyperi TaxID=1882483 RepID=A0A317XLU1_9BASI|nr:hypothetical protein BCV70DRAFT_163849 [Testicularia cyperi]